MTIGTLKAPANSWRDRESAYSSAVTIDQFFLLFFSLLPPTVYRVQATSLGSLPQGVRAVQEGREVLHMVSGPCYNRRCGLGRHVCGRVSLFGVTTCDCELRGKEGALEDVSRLFDKRLEEKDTAIKWKRVTREDRRHFRLYLMLETPAQFPFPRPEACLATSDVSRQDPRRPAQLCRRRAACSLLPIVPWRFRLPAPVWRFLHRP